MSYDLIKGDCLDLLPQLSAKCVDCVIVDPPYNITNCKWDKVIPFDIMWKELHRLTKENGAICIFGHEPFSSSLRSSNIQNFKYDWVWQKDKATNFLNCKKQPMHIYELISVFYKKQCMYNPQLEVKEPENVRPAKARRPQVDLYGSMDKASVRTIPITLTYPKNILKFRSCSSDKNQSYHPTQKPVDLLEYLIKTYTVEGETILDFTMGSGSTGVACVNLNRNFIGIEKEEKYFKIADQRISAAQNRRV